MKRLYYPRSWPSVCVVAVLLVGLSSSCASSGRAGRNVRLQSGTPYSKDIPLPEGFRLIDQSSEDWSSEAVRYLRHQYAGRADRLNVREFYRKQMPLVRWTADSESDVHGRCTMQFSRRNEHCTITIRKKRSVLRSRTVVDVIIAPGRKQDIS